MSTVAAMVRARADDDNVGLVSGDRRGRGGRWWPKRQRERRGCRATLDATRPPHVGVLLPNIPEFVFQILGAALAGACIVGLNTTRRGAELAHDIDHTSCQFVLADATYGDLAWARSDRGSAVADTRGQPLPDGDPPASTLMFLLLTSGSTSAPKAASAARADCEGCGNAVRRQGRAVLPDAAVPRKRVERGVLPRP